MVAMRLDDKSRFVTGPVTDRSPDAIAVMTFELTTRFTSCVNFGRLLGMRVSLFEPRSNVSTGVVGSMLVTMVSIAESVSPLAAHEIVSVVVLSLVGTQEQGRIEVVGHLQLRADSEANGVAAESAHVALTTKRSKVGSEISQPSPPQPVVAPQLKGSD